MDGWYLMFVFFWGWSSGRGGGVGGVFVGFLVGDVGSSKFMAV